MCNNSVVAGLGAGRHYDGSLVELAILNQALLPADLAFIYQAVRPVLRN